MARRRKKSPPKSASRSRQAYRVTFLSSAAEELAALLPRNRRQVAQKIDALQLDPRPRGSKALKGKGEGLYRLRSGGYRVLYRVEDEDLVVLVVKPGDRKDIYRGLQGEGPRGWPTASLPA